MQPFIDVKLTRKHIAICGRTALDRIKAQTYRRGVREVVPADRTARIRRHEPSPARSQRELRPPDREELHSVPAPDHLAALRPADPVALRRAPFGRSGRTRHRRRRHHGHLAFQHADQYRKYKESLRNSGTQEDNYRPAAQSGPARSRPLSKANATGWRARRACPWP